MLLYGEDRKDDNIMIVTSIVLFPHKREETNRSHLNRNNNKFLVYKIQSKIEWKYSV